MATIRTLECTLLFMDMVTATRIMVAIPTTKGHPTVKPDQTEALLAQTPLTHLTLALEPILPQPGL